MGIELIIYASSLVTLRQIRHTFCNPIDSAAAGIDMTRLRKVH